MTNHGETLNRDEIIETLRRCSSSTNDCELCLECPLYDEYYWDTPEPYSCTDRLRWFAANALLEDAGIISDLVDDFTSYVLDGGTPNPAPYCSNACDECKDERGWCKVDRTNCKGFAPNIGNYNGEVDYHDQVW